MKKLLITLLFGLASNALSTEESAFGGIAIPKEEETKILKCAFTIKDFLGAPSNEATCAMSPHEVFSDKWFTPNKDEHCSVEKSTDPRILEEFKNFRAKINFSKTGAFTFGFVTYDYGTGLNNVIIERQKEKEISEGKDAKELEERYKKKTLAKVHLIDDVVIQQTQVMTDLVTKEMLDFKDFYYTPLYVIHFNNSSLYFSEASPEATIISYWSNGGNSWIKQKFGTCGFL
jgi:hypothetical protein